MNQLKVFAMAFFYLISVPAFAVNHPVVDKCIELGFTNPSLVKEQISGYQESIATHNKGWEGEVSQKSYNVCLEFNGRNDKFHVHWKDILEGNTYQVYLDALAKRNIVIDEEINSLRKGAVIHEEKHKQLLANLDHAKARRDEFLVENRLYYKRFNLKSVIERGSLISYGAVMDRQEVVLYTTRDLSQGTYQAWAVRSVKPMQFVRTNGFKVEVFTFIEAELESPMVLEYEALNRVVKEADDARYKYYSVHLKNLKRDISKLERSKSRSLRL